MTQDLKPSLNCQPLVQLLSPVSGQDASWEQAVRGILVLLNAAGVDVVETLAVAPDELELTLERDAQPAKLWLKDLERKDSALPALSVMVGAKFMACKPSASPHEDCEVNFFYSPDCTSVQDLVDIAYGEITYKRIESIQNFSAEFAMSGPIARFPNCALIMLMKNPWSSDRRGNTFFKLWYQQGDVASIVDLEETSNPFEAAKQAIELGYSPTVYRCHSGIFINFKNTSGVPFL